MPIAFPPQDRGSDWNWVSRLASQEVTTDITNLARPGDEFVSNSSGGTDSAPGSVSWRTPVNVRNLGLDFEMSDGPANAQQYGPQFIPTQQPGVWIPQTDWAQTNRAIIGVTRDNTGAVLGNCSLDLYISGADILAAQATSDASGNFSFGNPGTGPFYIVAYKAGGTDVAGTTKNTLLPDPV